MRDAASRRSQWGLNAKEGYDVVDYDYAYGGDVSSDKSKHSKLAFAPGGVGMFMDTVWPPGLLLGG